MTAARERMRLQRDRRDCHTIQIRVWCYEPDLLAVLRKAGFIGEHERDPERPELERLMQHVFDLWLEPVAGS